MGRLVHLEIHVDDMELAKKFYKSGSGTRSNVEASMNMAASKEGRLRWKIKWRKVRAQIRSYLFWIGEYFIFYTKWTKWTFNSYYDRAIYEAPIVSGKVRFHPSQSRFLFAKKSLQLIQMKVKRSTGQAAKNHLKRNFIDFELDNTYLKKFRKLCIMIP